PAGGCGSGRALSCDGSYPRGIARLQKQAWCSRAGLRLSALLQEFVLVLLKVALDGGHVLTVVDEIRGFVVREPFAVEPPVKVLLIVLQGFDHESNGF